MDVVQNIPAPQIPAGGGESKAYETLRMDEADFAKSLGLDAIVPENAQPRDEKGKFIAQETVLVDTTLAKPAVEQPAEVVADTITDGEKPAEETTEQVEKPAVKAPLTKFTAVDASGNAVEIPADLKLHYKVDGKEVDLPVEKVVHLAQQNGFNARQVQTLSEALTTRDTQLTQYQETIQNYERHVARMFQNPDVYDEARASWLEANSPEKRAERAEARVTSLEQQHAAVNEATQAAQFVEGTVLPTLKQLAEQYPGVTEDDLLGRLALFVPAYMVNGKVPLANLPKLQQFVETDLATWANAVHDSRAQAINAAKADASKSLQKEQAQSQSLKRQVGKVLAPVSANAQAPTAKPTTIKKASDVLNDPLFGGGN